MNRIIPIGERDHPLEPRRAAVITLGLLGFVTGFAVAGLAVLANQGGHPVWYISIAFGLVSIAVVGYAISRGNTPMPQAPIWSPTTLRHIARSAGAPVPVVLFAFYLLLVVGVLGNLLVPLAFGGR